MIKEILVVDDEPHMARAMAEALRRKRYEVETAGSAEEALTLLGRDLYRMVVSDIRMGGLDGKELLKRIKTISPRTVVLLVTAFGTIEDAVDVMKFGASDYILKPFSADQLQEAVGHYYPRDFSPIKYPSLLSVDPLSKDLMKMAERAAKTNATVLIQGESGVGKELLARYIHDKSPRSSGPFVAINCAAIPENLLESELFGYEKGSFTGALHSKPGKFELAQEGTLVLDEVSELHPSLQSKLLRVLQEREVDRVGGLKPIPVDVRLIAVTNRDLRLWVKEGKFREDLFFRLNVLSMTFPPLRKRREDLKLLAGHFTELFARENGKPGLKLSPAAWEKVMGYPWPGNVRELQNVLQRAVILADGESLQPQDLGLPEGAPAAVQEAEPSDLSLAELEKRTILFTLEKNGGNRRKSAEILGISERTLRNKLKEYRVSGPEENEE